MNQQQGFVVLIVVVLIVSSILVIVSGSAAVSWHGRQMALEREYESIAIGHAESCMQRAAFMLAINPGYVSGEMVSNLPGGGSCAVINITSPNYTVAVEARHKGVLAKLSGYISPDTFKISSVRLLAN